MKCGVRSVELGVRSVELGVRSVEREMWSVECGVDDNGKSFSQGKKQRIQTTKCRIVPLNGKLSGIVLFLP